MIAEISAGVSTSLPRDRAAKEQPGRRFDRVLSNPQPALTVATQPRPVERSCASMSSMEVVHRRVGRSVTAVAILLLSTACAQRADKQTLDGLSAKVRLTTTTTTTTTRVETPDTGPSTTLAAAVPAPLKPGDDYQPIPGDEGFAFLFTEPDPTRESYVTRWHTLLAIEDGIVDHLIQALEGGGDAEYGRARTQCEEDFYLELDDLARRTTILDQALEEQVARSIGLGYDLVAICGKNPMESEAVRIALHDFEVVAAPLSSYEDCADCRRL
jgi:hypothetical protein